MTIHLRSVTEDNGDVVDHAWYCSQFCYAESIADDPPSDHFEQGGAYPCGAESDSPAACAGCGEPVGNPITGEGIETIREWLESEPGEFAQKCAALYDIGAVPA